MKDEKKEEIAQALKATLENELKGENLDLSDLEEVEGGIDVGCSAVFSGGCSTIPTQPVKTN